MQVWADLRSQGIRTPEIAIWQRVPQPSKPFSAANRATALYPKVLNVYNEPRFSQVCGAQLSCADHLWGTCNEVIGLSDNREGPPRLPGAALFEDICP